MCGRVFLRNVKSPIMKNIISVKEDHAVQSAVKFLKEGHVIGVPTDTIYGLAALAQNTAAVQRLYDIKHRDLNNPIAICVGEMKDVSLWGETGHLPKGLLQNLLPGAVTVALHRTPALNPALNPGHSLVGLRIPNHKFIQEVAKLCAAPLALTSANISTEPSALSIAEFQGLWPSLKAVFDGGTLGNNREGSTVVVLNSPGKFKIKRDGSSLDLTVSVAKDYGLVQV